MQSIGLGFGRATVSQSWLRGRERVLGKAARQRPACSARHFFVLSKTKSRVSGSPHFWGLCVRRVCVVRRRRPHRRIRNLFPECFCLFLIFRALFHGGCEASKPVFRLSRACPERGSGEDKSAGPGEERLGGRVGQRATPGVGSD